MAKRDGVQPGRWAQLRRQLQSRMARLTISYLAVIMVMSAGFSLVLALQLVQALQLIQARLLVGRPNDPLYLVNTRYDPPSII